MRRLLLLAIRLYQLVLSPLLPQACRFYPTCSRYAYAAVERFGFLRGSWLGAWRVLRCHPWHPGGFDPVPEAGPAGKYGQLSHVHRGDAEDAERKKVGLA